MGAGQKLILRMFPRSSVGAWTDSWGCVATLAGMGCQGTIQKITKLQACGELLGNNSNSCGAVWGWVQINPVTVFPAPVWAHGLIVGGV